MERDVGYASKLVKGKELPELVPKMRVGIKQHSKWNGPDFYSDIVFSNYAEIIGQKRYVAYKIEEKYIYFRFYDSHENNVHRFKMFYSESKDVHSFGDELAVNVSNKPAITSFYSELWYPVYYLRSSDEYFIKLDDGKRTKLFITNRKEHKTMGTETARGFKIDVVKLTSLIKKTGKTSAACSREMGYSDGALSNAFRTGNMSYGMAERLNKCYRISRTEYEFQETAEEKEEKTVVVTEPNKVEFVISAETENKLYDIIYRAVYEAVKKAWNE